MYYKIVLWISNARREGKVVVAPGILQYIHARVLRSCQYRLQQVCATLNVKYMVFMRSYLPVDCCWTSSYCKEIPEQLVGVIGPAHFLVE